MDAILATLLTLSNDIVLTVEFYRNYFGLRRIQSESD